MKRIVMFSVIALAACDRDQPPAPTAAQTSQLNEADDMLNDLAAKEEGPGDRAPGPSNSTD